MKLVIRYIFHFSAGFRDDGTASHYYGRTVKPWRGVLPPAA